MTERARKRLNKRNEHITNTRNTLNVLVSKNVVVLQDDFQSDQIFEYSYKNED